MDLEKELKLYKKQVGLRLQRAREDAGFTSQQEAADALAREIGLNTLPHSRIGNYEQGARLPDPITMGKLCKIYGVSPAQIYALAEAPMNQEEVALLTKYRLTDDRGRRAIHGIAESQPAVTYMPALTQNKAS